MWFALNTATAPLMQHCPWALRFKMFGISMRPLAFRIARNSQIKIKLLCFSFRMMILFVRLMAHFLYWWSFLMSFPFWIALERCQHKIDIFFVILQMFSSVDVITTIVASSYSYSVGCFFCVIISFLWFGNLFLSIVECLCFWLCGSRIQEARKKKQDAEQFFKRLFILCWERM